MSASASVSDSMAVTDRLGWTGRPFMKPASGTLNQRLVDVGDDLACSGAGNR